MLVQKGGKVMNENVEHPKHYLGTKNIECIDAMEMIFGKDAVKDFCLINVFKYIWRDGVKDGDNLEKARYCLDYIYEPSLDDHERAIYSKLDTILTNMEDS